VDVLDSVEVRLMAVDVTIRGDAFVPAGE